MIRVGIMGGAGYTAGELLRLLVTHPGVQIAFVQSTSQAGRPISALHPDLVGELDTSFVPKVSDEIDVLFLCAGHGRSREFMREMSPPDRVKIIDLSADFRSGNNDSQFVYGLPELNREAIARASRIANPGCFATAIQLGLLPLAARGLLKSSLHVHALTGSTGAGQQPTATTHFSWRDNNVSIYKPFTHQHLAEIRQSLRQLQTDFSEPLHFLPIRGNFTRGIFASIYLESEIGLSATQEMYTTYYGSHPFVRIVSQNPALKQVVNTNNCQLFLQKIAGNILIISMIDNLVKGASGQAIQNMNLMFGLDEKLGLRLKASAF